MAEGPGRRGRAGAGLLARALRKLSAFRALGAAEKALFSEAWVRIAWARLFARRIYPAIRVLGGIQSTRERTSVVETFASGHQSGGAVDLATMERLFLLAVRHQPGVVLCVPRARSLCGFVARRGFRAYVRVGVRRDLQGRLEAHAWAEVDGRAIAERPVPTDFRVIQVPS